jgi:hypothetical protein
MLRSALSAFWSSGRYRPLTGAEISQRLGVRSWSRELVGVLTYAAQCGLVSRSGIRSSGVTISIYEIRPAGIELLNHDIPAQR